MFVIKVGTFFLKVVMGNKFDAVIGHVIGAWRHDRSGWGCRRRVNETVLSRPRAESRPRTLGKVKLLSRFRLSSVLLVEQTFTLRGADEP